MDIIYVLLPLAIGLALVGLFGFIWAVSRGQFDDLDTPALRILSDDVEEKHMKRIDREQQVKDE